MRSQIVSLLAFLGCTAATKGFTGWKDLPDGPYQGVTNPDGSTTITSLDTGKSYNFEHTEEHGENQARSLSLHEKRFTDCWGYELDHGGVDAGVVQLKNWAGTGHDWSSGARPDYFGFNNRGVYVYYCINAPHSFGNIDVVDIDYALQQMDARCKRYEASYFRWDGSPELVGKCRSGTAVCLG